MWSWWTARLSTHVLCACAWECILCTQLLFVRFWRTWRNRKKLAKKKSFKRWLWIQIQWTSLCAVAHMCDERTHQMLLRLTSITADKDDGIASSCGHTINLEFYFSIQFSQNGLVNWMKCTFRLGRRKKMVTVVRMCFAEIRRSAESTRLKHRGKELIAYRFLLLFFYHFLKCCLSCSLASRIRIKLNPRLTAVSLSLPLSWWCTVHVEWYTMIVNHEQYTFYRKL